MRNPKTDACFTPESGHQPLTRCVIGHYRSQWLNPWSSLRRTDYVVSPDNQRLAVGEQVSMPKSA
jgi:hypothetical protein